ncbi:23 kDa integral membrane protein-like [Sitodiplosis mosellana]|uniref:23 kDa integral membrane protein-like n=1 Tax=Sitodiplosis mosellana TaxID=263140 RepID=UPI00244461B5|nr:23 kDa integral membrane protein-like [Sitodiplosis mosellana]
MCSVISKIWLFVFNSIFFFGGVVLCTFGGLILAFRHKANTAATNVDDIWTIGIVLIVLGVIVMLVTFLGCFGATLDNKSMLLTFAILLTLIVVAQIGIGIYVGVQKNFSEKLTQGFIHTNWNHVIHKDHIDWCQETFECCGYIDYTEYRNNTNLILPSTCCKGHEKDHKYMCPVKDAYMKGCKQAFSQFLKQNRGIIIGVLCGFALFQIIGIVFSCVLVSKANRHY